jgi:hypothetical protein
MSDRRDLGKEVERVIQSGDLTGASAIINSVRDYSEGEEVIFGTLNGNAPVEFIEAALKKFIATRQNRRGEHGYWVHSLSHFIDKLWVRGMANWIGTLNEIAFRGANELGDTNCSDRLVYSFAVRSPWDADPADYGITPESTKWYTANEYNIYAIARLAEGKFTTEEGYLRWLIRHKEFTEFDYDLQEYMVDAANLTTTINRISELGGDITEFDGLVERRLRDQLAKMEAGLAAAADGWKIERYTKGLAKAKSELALFVG